MQYFSDEYLEHHGIRGQKWKHKKNFKTPAEYLDEAYDDLGNYTKGGMTAERLKLHRDNVAGRVPDNGSLYQRQQNIRKTQNAKVAESVANKRRNDDLRKARKKAYKTNQKRIARQQRKAKVRNAIKNFVDPPLQVEYYEPVITSTSGRRR